MENNQLPPPFCSKCKQTSSPSAKFCMNCGAKILPNNNNNLPLKPSSPIIAPKLSQVEKKDQSVLVPKEPKSQAFSLGIFLKF